MPCILGLLKFNWIIRAALKLTSQAEKCVAPALSIVVKAYLALYSAQSALARHV